MKKAKQSKVVGLGWANRAVSGKKSKLPVFDEGLRRIAGNLAASIQNACWLTLEKQANLHGPTMAMQDAVAAYLEWKRDNND